MVDQDQSMSQRLLDDNETEVEARAVDNVENPCKRRMRLAGGGIMTCVVVAFVLIWLLQGILYFIATTAYGCREGALENYDYRGSAGAENSSLHSAEFNVLPESTYLTKMPHSFYGQSFAVLPLAKGGGDGGGGSAHEAPVGTWWRAWGPVFNTYVYIDTYGSNTLLWMRRSMLRLGQSHRIGRCDGSQDMIEVEEGLNWFSNSIRSALGMQQTMTLKVFWDKNDGKGRLQVATVEETNGQTSVPSITFFGQETNGRKVKWADASLQNGAIQTWYVKNEHNNDLPFYVLSAATLVLAFRWNGDTRAASAMEMPQIQLVNSTVPVGMASQSPLHV